MGGSVKGAAPVAPTRRRKPQVAPAPATATPAPAPTVSAPRPALPQPGLAFGANTTTPNPAPQVQRFSNPFKRGANGKRPIGEFASGANEKAGFVRERFADPALEVTEVPSEWVELAENAHIVAQAIQAGNPDTSDLESFGDVDGASQALGTTGFLSLAGDSLSMLDSVKGGVSGARGLYKSTKSYDAEDGRGASKDSIGRTLAMQQLESSITGFGLSGGGIGGDVMDIASLGTKALTDYVPIVGGVKNIAQGGLDAKAATEDSIAAERLRRQKRRAKHDLDQQLPMSERIDRFKTFRTQYSKWSGANTTIGTQNTALKAAKGEVKSAKSALSKLKKGDAGYATAESKVTTAQAAVDKAQEEKSKAGKDRGAAKSESKRGEFGRFDKAVTEFLAANASNLDPRDAANDAKLDVFLGWLKTSQTKDFGYGTDTRKNFERTFKADRDANGVVKDEWARYDEARNLHKGAGFMHRRKAKSATMHSIDAVGNLADGIGEFTAGADFGATKTTGKTIKALKAGGVAAEKLFKRGRRVHKLRTAKNDMQYGNKQRSWMWGAKTFFYGDVAGQMATARSALTDDDAGRALTGAKKAGATVTPAQRRKLLRRLTLQCARRIDELLVCLLSPDESVRRRAKKIVHVVVETNLMGALSNAPGATGNSVLKKIGGLASIKDEDLDRYRSIYLKAHDLGDDNKPLPPGTAGSTRKAEHAKVFAERKKALTELLDRQLTGGV